jgi:hypothetical protein
VRIFLALDNNGQGLGIDMNMHRTLTLFLAPIAMLAVCVAAERRWQTGVWGDITTKRRIVDFGPGASGFGRPGGSPSMRAMADVRRFIIETDGMRLELEDTVPVGRRSFEAATGGMITFAVEKNTVYVRDGSGTEHKLRLIKKTDRARAAAAPAKPAYAALGGGHLVRAVTDKGRFVILEDGSRWEISPRDQYLSAEWEVLANVSVRTLPRAENGFVYELINTSTDEGAVANYVAGR